MSVSFTSGTNWSNANLPTIDPDHPAAAKELNVTIEDLAAGGSRSGALSRVDLSRAQVESAVPGHRGEVREQSLVAVVAARIVETHRGRRRAGGRDSVLDLTARGRRRVAGVDRARGRRVAVVQFWMHGTGQTASPSASINYTVNYLDRDGAEAVIDYWDKVVLTPELRAQIAQNPRAQMYMDSLELTTYGAGGLFWGRTRRRGVPRPGAATTSHRGCRS